MAYPKALKIPLHTVEFREDKTVKAIKANTRSNHCFILHFNTFTFEKLVKLTDEHTSSYSHLRDSGAADAKLSTQRLPDGTKPEPRSSYGVSNHRRSKFIITNILKRLNIMTEADDPELSE